MGSFLHGLPQNSGGGGGPWTGELWTALIHSFRLSLSRSRGAGLSQPGASGIVEKDPDAELIGHTIETCHDGARRLRTAVKWIGVSDLLQM